MSCTPIDASNIKLTVGDVSSEKYKHSGEHLIYIDHVRKCNFKFKAALSSALNIVKNFSKLEK